MEITVSESKMKTLNRITSEVSRVVGGKERMERMAELVVPELGDWCIIDMINEKEEMERVAIVHANTNKVKELKEN